MRYLKWFLIFLTIMSFAAPKSKKAEEKKPFKPAEVQVEKKYQNKSYHLVQYLSDDKAGLANWGNLFYFGAFKKDIEIKENENFIEKPVFQQNKTLKTSKGKVYQQLYKIEIDNEMNVEDLLEASEVFASSLKKAIYDSDIFLPPTSAGEESIHVKSFFPFTGENNLISLILKCGYYIEKEKLRSLQTKYHPSPHAKIVIEARHLKLKPSMFPQIYTYDASGNKILIYSLSHSNFTEISNKGYAHFYTDLHKLNVKKEKAFYCPAIELSGTKKTDIVINREDYIKLFSSPISLKNLSEGNLYIIISKNTFIKKKIPKEGEEDLQKVKDREKKIK